MKKFKYLIIALLILVSFLMPFTVACSDGYTTVCKIVFTTNGEEKTLYSRGYPSYTSWTKIDKTEYFSAPDSRHVEHKIIAYTLSSDFKVPSAARGQTTYTKTAKATDDDDLVRYSYEWSTTDKVGYYYKASYKGEVYLFVLVKVVNSTTIVVRNTTGETTYTVSSYRITYFD